ncbi:hypothetical protein FAF44_45695 [Nonomuraea sp. MG754425]|uniref:hypothetical protein n=1 Tax=Nonomuraea sp. MG754425 TaxID=2570319 RepID=UPI001F402387|nr:hypothetical protein [Nonomuraea sp. MG754425]MCF6475597.1 hypothetical protein [Nonomuraea sp. MG754425]
MTATRTAGGLAAVAALTLSGHSAMLLVVVVAAILALCWVVADRHRSSHLAMLIRSLRPPRGSGEQHGAKD